HAHKEVALMTLRNWIFGTIVLLAVFGLSATLIANPFGLLQNIFITLLIVGAIYGIYRLFLAKKIGNEEQRKFMQAERQSNTRMQKKKKSHVPRAKARNKPLRKRKHVHLTVIEGKKGKKDKKNNR